METPEQSGKPSDVPPAGREPIVVLDIAVGAAALAVTSTRVVGRRVQGVLRPVAGLVLRPPMVPARYQAETLLAAVARQGGSRRPDLSRRLSAALDLIVPTVVAAVLARIDVTRIVTERVNLNEVVASVDLDKAVERLDLNAVLARLDLDALIDRIDLAEVAEGVIAEVDLTEIIRQSTGSVASDTVQGVRMQGISGDEAVGRALGRLRLRFSRKERVVAEP